MTSLKEGIRGETVLGMQDEGCYLNCKENEDHVT
jgi:hypothetical protein